VDPGTKDPGPGDPKTHGDPALFASLYTSQLVLRTFACSLAANPLFDHHNASHDVYQIRITHTLSNEHTSQLLHLAAEIMNI